MKDLINNDTASLVDVRTKVEFILGHVKGSINIPMNDVPNKIEELKKMSKPLIVFCQSGNRSGQVLDFLVNQGFENTYNGGGWQEVKSLKNK